MRRMSYALALVAALAPVQAAAEPFRLETYFAGKTVAEGSFRAINGVNRSFTVDLTGSWNGRTLTLVEDFVYEDGERDRKTWRFTRTGNDTYAGTREDVIGETTVHLNGDTATFTYRVWLDGEARTNQVRFYDTMTLRADGTLVNRALVTKYGLPVAYTRVEFSRP